MKTPKVLIGIEGGLVQWIMSDVPVETIRLDHDVEGCEPKEITTYTDIDGDQGEAFVVREKATVNATFVNRIFKDIKG